MEEEVKIKIPRYMGPSTVADVLAVYLLGYFAFANGGKALGPFSRSSSSGYTYQLDTSNDYWLFFESKDEYKVATLACRYPDQSGRLKAMAKLFEITYGEYEWKPKS